MAYLNMRLKYGPYLKNEEGVKKFAEMAMGRLIERVTKKSAAYREMNENLLVEKANLRMRGDEIFQAPMVGIDEYFTIRRRVVGESFTAWAVVIAEIALLLNYIPHYTFVMGDSTFVSLLQWFVAIVLAIVLTGLSILIAERLIESLLPVYRYKQTEPMGYRASLAVTVLWAVSLIGVEVAIIGITVAARDTQAGQLGAVLHLGFVILAVVLPIVAGAIRWDVLHFLDAYKSTQQYRRIETRLSQIDSILRQNEEYENIFYKVKSTAYWDMINEFRTYKENHNAKEGIREDLTDHFARNNDAFQAEAQKRYDADLRDITPKAMRPSSEKLSGGKLSQMPMAMHEGPPAVKPGMPAVKPSLGDGEPPPDELSAPPDVAEESAHS